MIADQLSTKMKPGAVVALHNIPAWLDTMYEEDSQREEVSGLFHIIDFEQCSEFSTEDGYWRISFCPSNPSECGMDYLVHEKDLWPQVDPKSYAEHLLCKREVGFMLDELFNSNHKEAMLDGDVPFDLPHPTIDLGEFVSDYLALDCEGITANEIAEAYIERTEKADIPSADYEAKMKSLIPAIRYYLS